MVDHHARAKGFTHGPQEPHGELENIMTVSQCERPACDCTK